MSNIHETNPEELGKVVGGFIYEGPKEWLRGYKIACPFCNCEDRDVIEDRGSYRETNAYFRCTQCKRTFSYHFMNQRNIELWKDR